jgi:translation elongation factor EF-4
MELCQSRRGELGGHGLPVARTRRTALHMPLGEIIFDFFDR